HRLVGVIGKRGKWMEGPENRVGEDAEEEIAELEADAAATAARIAARAGEDHADEQRQEQHRIGDEDDGDPSANNEAGGALEDAAERAQRALEPRAGFPRLGEAVWKAEEELTFAGDAQVPAVRMNQGVQPRFRIS